MATPSRTTRALIDRVFERISADAIGEIYLDEGGAAFFEALRPRIVEDGVAWAEALAPRVRNVPSPSLYVGAGLAELPAMLVEAVELERRVVAANLRAAECECLNTALRRAGVDQSVLEFRAQDARDLLARGPFGHLAIVSVLTDPETYPVISAVGYGRLPPVLLDVATFEKERVAVRALVEALLAQLVLPGLVTTTGEEAPWILDWARARGVEVEVDDVALGAAVVGDPIGFMVLRGAAP